MFITATELKKNLSKYLVLASKQDIFITQYGKTVAILTNPFPDRVEIVESLFGALPQTTTAEKALSERANEL